LKWVDVSGVRLDTDACLIALQQHLTKTLLLLQSEYMQEITSHYAQSPASNESSQILSEGDVQILAGYIATEIIGGAYAAMAEWGRGSKMDPNNPALPNYITHSGLWNTYRTNDLAIRSRKAGMYVNIFGDAVVSTDKNPGRNLEEELGGKYAPWEPTHGMVETATRWMTVGRIEEIWRGALTTFPWGKFIIATSD
jgi:hypothetical protein